MKSKYFFPVPRIPIRPAELIATASGNSGGAGPLGNYGLNVGPMLISWLFRFVNGRLEQFIGKALSDANKREKKKKRAEKKANEKREAAIAKEERRAVRKARKKEKEVLKKAADAAAKESGDSSSSTPANLDQATVSNSDQPSQMDELD